MNDRKLATVETVASLAPIEGADRIEVAGIRGWKVVVGKGQFAIGEKVIYFEVDACLPLDDPRFTKFGERSTKTLPSGRDVHVLRTIKLRGQVSQGLVMGLGELGLSDDLTVGDDLTDALGIVKWMPSVEGIADAVGSFTTQFADKTDSERVQNLSDDILAELAQYDWQATEKVDGSSVTVTLTDEGVRVCSRNLEVGPASMHHRAVVASGILDLMAVGDTVQGEIVGPGVNGNRLRLDAPRIIVFDLWRNRVLVARDEWPAWAVGLAAPVLDLPFPATVDEAVEQVNKMASVVNPQVQAEGIVWHTVDGSQPVDGRSTFKAINNAYLLKHGE